MRLNALQIRWCVGDWLSVDISERLRYMSACSRLHQSIPSLPNECSESIPGSSTTSTSTTNSTVTKTFCHCKCELRHVIIVHYAI